MTDKYKGCIITFDTDIHADDAEAILNAIRMIKHVVDVAPMTLHHEDYMNRARVRAEFKLKLYQVLEEQS